MAKCIFVPLNQPALYDQCISKTKAQIIFATRAWKVPLIIRLSLEHRRATQHNVMLWIQTRSNKTMSAVNQMNPRRRASVLRFSLWRAQQIKRPCARSPAFASSILLVRFSAIVDGSLCWSERGWPQQTENGWCVCYCALRIQSPACWRHCTRPSPWRPYTRPLQPGVDALW